MNYFNFLGEEHHEHPSIRNLSESISYFGTEGQVFFVTTTSPKMMRKRKRNQNA